MKLREEWEGREVKEQRTQGTGGENPTIGREFRGMIYQEVRDEGHWPQEVWISCHGGVAEQILQDGEKSSEDQRSERGQVVEKVKESWV